MAENSGEQPLTPTSARGSNWARNKRVDSANKLMAQIKATRNMGDDSDSDEEPSREKEKKKEKKTLEGKVKSERRSSSSRSYVFLRKSGRLSKGDLCHTAPTSFPCSNHPFFVLDFSYLLWPFQAVVPLSRMLRFPLPPGLEHLIYFSL